MPVDLARDEGGEEFLGELVVHGDALALPVMLVQPHRLEADGGGEQLVRDLVVRAAAAVHGVVGVPVLRRMMPEKSHRPEATQQRAMLTR